MRKNFSLAILVLSLTMISCNSKRNHVVHLPTKEDSIQANWRKNPTSGLAILEKIASERDINAIDSLHYPFERALEEDTSRVMVIGRFIDDNKIYALDLIAHDSIIRFFNFEGTKWRQIGSGPVDDYTYTVDFQDLDGDNRNEIITATNRNMNGNRWMTIFYCSPINDVVHKAGSFSTDFRIDAKNKTIQTYYEGSWYMDHEQTLYRWHGEQLLPVRKIVLGLKQKNMKSNRQFIALYENPTVDKDTLALKFRKTYRSRNQKQYNLVNHFFGKDTLYGFQN